MLQILNIYRCTFVLYTMLFTFDLCVTSGGFNPVQRSQQDGWISGPELHQKLRRFMDDVIGYKTVQVSMLKIRLMTEMGTKNKNTHTKIYDFV